MVPARKVFLQKARRSVLRFLEDCKTADPPDWMELIERIIVQKAMARVEKVSMHIEAEAATSVPLTLRVSGFTETFTAFITLAWDKRCKGGGSSAVLLTVSGC